MSNRLGSLNPDKTAAKAGLKFKPKAVARKSKEDRDKSAPKTKTETPQRSHASARGRGSSRGRGRGRGGAYVGTHVVSAGPLAMGSVGMGGGTTTTKTGLTNDRIYTSGDSTSSAPLAGLKLKSRDGAVKKLEGDPADSDGDDPTKINMNKEYAFDDSETVLFPVRPHKHLASVLGPELVLESSTSPSASMTPMSRAQTVETVKSEEFDGVAPEIIESKFTPAPLLVNPDEKQEADEHDRIIDDQKSIVDMLTQELDNMKTDDAADAGINDQYVLVHVPQIKPKSGEFVPSKSHFASASAQNFDGQVGSLNFHQSGKITMTVGDGTVFQCAGGNPSSFLQELYIIENSEANIDPDDVDEDAASVLDADGRKIAGRIYRLGQIAGKIVATPAIH